MGKFIIVGCDLHDKNMLLKVAVDQGEPETMHVPNTVEGRQKMIHDLRQRAANHSGSQIVLAYEASSQGFGLYDELTAAGIRCHVLAPTKMKKSVQERKRKTDERDAQQILELVRGQLLAGNGLPVVWVPDRALREDRELVRSRLDAAEKVVAMKAQIRMLLKRNGLRAPEKTSRYWGKNYYGWLQQLLTSESGVSFGVQQGLASLLRQQVALEEEVAILDREMRTLATSPRYDALCRALQQESGVGAHVALVFLTELGDLTRFRNRRQVGAFLGLVPSCNDSGESEQKGYITHQGPYRVRKVLCQAVWAMLKSSSPERAVYERIGKRETESAPQENRGGGPDAAPGDPLVAYRAGGAVGEPKTKTRGGLTARGVGDELRNNVDDNEGSEIVFPLDDDPSASLIRSRVSEK